jgi:hypothetical protein
MFKKFFKKINIKIKKSLIRRLVTIWIVLSGFGVVYGFGVRWGFGGMLLN